MNEKHLLTEDGVLKTLLRFSLPFLAANIIQALYGAVDLWVIGRYCPPASVAAVSTGTQVTQIITSMVSGLTLGGTILVGRYTCLLYTSILSRLGPKAGGAKARQGIRAKSPVRRERPGLR